MKIIKFFSVLLLLIACSENTDKTSKKWMVDVSGIGVNVELIDISKDFYNLDFPISEFRKKYPFYLDVEFPDAEYDTQRRDTTELNIYTLIKQKIDNNKIKEDLSGLFRHIKYYYPEFKEPKVYIYSSYCQNFLMPIAYESSENRLFIAADCFLGYENKYYDLLGIDKYLQYSMSPEYITAKAAKAIITKLNLVPRESTSQSFISQMIYQGKILTLVDAFLPNVADEYKIEYTKEQLDWAQSNEYQIWNFFVESNYVFSDNINLGERFLALAPFSKFYTEADNKSPGRIGAWIGWQICRKYLNENPKITIQEFAANPNGEEIFSKSKYKPEQISE